MILTKNRQNTDFQYIKTDINTENQAYRKEIFLRTADALLLKKGEIVLELNHNGADFLSHIFSVEPSIFYIGAENSKKANLNAKFQNQNLYAKGKADFISWDGENLDFESESLDKIFSVDSLHLWKNIPETLREIHRVLKENGRLILSFDNEILAKNEIFGIEEIIFNAGFQQVIKQKVKQHILLENNGIERKNITILHLSKR